MTVVKFICREVAGIQRAEFPENELFHGLRIFLEQLF